jgi:hypothetical protein
MSNDWHVFILDMAARAGKPGTQSNGGALFCYIVYVGIIARYVF